ncbi:hypothetical protein ONZ45_g8096 [Pleurotus djamor]|nr:hypothetical protein ONZ45_g8096 [Pleurotus djamor]
MPPFDLENCKAQARDGSYDAIKKLVAVIEHLNIKEQLDIWDIFAEILAESPPSIEVLKNNMLQEMSLIEKLKAIWTDIWKWVHSTFLYHRHSPLPRSTKTLINDSDSMSDSTFQVVAMCQLCALYLSCTGKDYVSVMFTPSFIHLFSSWWLESAGNRSVSLQVCQMICLLVKLFVQFEDAPTTMVMVEALGSSASFATCLLTYLRVDARETSPASLISVYSGVMLGSSRQFNEPHKSLFPAIAKFFNIFGQFCLYRSNIKALMQPMDELQEENWQGHFETPELEGAWSLFKECFAEGKSAKERRDSPLKMCTSCGTKAFRKHFYQCGHCKALYCNTVCQGLDWRGGNHRSVCVNHAYMMPYEDFETILLRSRTLIARFLPRLVLFYHKFVVATRRNDLPPLLCIVDMTCFPQMITLHPDMSDAAYAQIGDVTPTRLAQFHPCLLVFAVLPPVDRSKLLFIHGTLQPSPSYTSYQEFLDSSPDPDASQAQLQLEIASESLFPDVSFRWVTGGDWDSDNVTI